MSGILLTVLPWAVLTGLLFLSGKLFLLWRDEKKKVAIEKKKSEKITEPLSGKNYVENLP